MAISLRRRSLTRVFILLALALTARLLISHWSTPSRQSNVEIRENGVLERVTGSDKTLNVQKHKFLQARMGRDNRDDIFDDLIKNGMDDFWDHYQKPYMNSRETSHMDVQSVLLAIDQLLSLNGWVAALCPTLTRPFGQNKYEENYNDLASAEHLYYIAIVIHSADHFLVDQLAVIVQMAKRLGAHNLFVSMLDYDSTDSTETLTDLCEAVLTLLGIPFRIRRVPGMTEDPVMAYYPLEEAHMRNLVLEPLHELHAKRNIKFSRVVWLKGFTCPNDILETLKVSFANEAAMVCGMDWAEHNGFFIFSDRWRTRDIEGDQFRQSKSSSKANAAPPRDKVGASRYAQHLPFQVFCCESGTHVVDPAQSYYKGVAYRAGQDFYNVSSSDPVRSRQPDASCLDSSQAWFCRDLWTQTARDAMREVDAANGVPMQKRAEEEPIAPRQLAKVQADGDEIKDDGPKIDAVAKDRDPDANAGSDYDAMDEDEIVEESGSTNAPLSIPNSVFTPARILVNPRCVTTYAGISHTQLALYLFGGPEHEKETERSKYVLDDWEGAPEGFVCQEQTRTGGRKASKTQRRLGFSIHDELERLKERETES